MIDSPAAGSYYTWNNKQEPQTRVYSRLDRVLVNNHWIHHRPNTYAHFYNEGIFDHTPCIIQEPAASMKGRRSFKYFNMWNQVPEFKPCITHHWNQSWQGTKMFKVVMKLKSLKRPLKDLNKDLFNDIENSAVHAWKILDNIQDQLRTAPGDPTLLVKEKEAAGVYRELQAACDSFLTQKSKATWLIKGTTTLGIFISAFLKYYETLLGTAGHTTPVCASVVQQGPICNSEHHSILLVPVTKKEIKEAFFSIPTHKAPRPDGFSSAFFKDSWSVVGDEVCDAILDFFSVCKNQGGFVKGRSIAENILICQDLVRLYNRKAVSPRCLMKIDLKKAYDSVHWDFVEQMLIAL
ncbi:uncharacterized protein LOC141588175 [Silene latifolia]|uniref:uncharacterized protein LOC141588175 n=1 Tax=Silene latifolia TaxID=37657 RepID=UPI003D77ED45